MLPTSRAVLGIHGGTEKFGSPQCALYTSIMKDYCMRLHKNIRQSSMSDIEVEGPASCFASCARTNDTRTLSKLCTHSYMKSSRRKQKRDQTPFKRGQTVIWKTPML